MSDGWHEVMAHEEALKRKQEEQARTQSQNSSTSGREVRSNSSYSGSASYSGGSPPEYKSRMRYFLDELWVYWHFYFLTVRMRLGPAIICDGFFPILPFRMFEPEIQIVKYILSFF